jgi:hypothetical protein
MVDVATVELFCFLLIRSSPKEFTVPFRNFDSVVNATGNSPHRSDAKGQKYGER